MDCFNRLQGHDPRVRIHASEITHVGVQVLRDVLRRRGIDSGIAGSYVEIRTQLILHSIGAPASLFATHWIPLDRPAPGGYAKRNLTDRLDFITPVSQVPACTTLIAGIPTELN